MIACYFYSWLFFKLLLGQKCHPTKSTIALDVKIIHFFIEYPFRSIFHNVTFFKPQRSLTEFYKVIYIYYSKLIDISHLNCWILNFAQISPIKNYLHSTTSMLQIMTSSLIYTMFLGATMTSLCLPESLVNVPKMQEEEIMANAIPRMIPSNGAYCISYC